MRGNKPKAPGRGAVPLRADEKDLHIARLEAELRQLTGRKSPAPKRTRGEEHLHTHTDTCHLAWRSTLRLRKKTSEPGQEQEQLLVPDAAATFQQAHVASVVIGDAPSSRSDADEQHQLQNALDLVANLEMIESDPSIGSEEVEPPAGRPRLQQEILVIPNGKCFALCCIAAMDPDDWASVPRKADGAPASLEHLIDEDDKVRKFLLNTLSGVGMPDTRIRALVQGEYAEAQDLTFFAAAMGGAIGVVPPQSVRALQDVRFFGRGALRMQVELYFLEGNRAPHYKLLQTWS